MCGVPASAAEAETGGLFMAGQEAIPIITALQTTVLPDNSTTHDILFAPQVCLKGSKAFDLRYHWIKDGMAKKQFYLYWAKDYL